jgi:hypothetical protein
MIRSTLLILLPAFIAAKLYQVLTLLAPAARYHLNDLYDASTTKKMWG